MVTEKFYIFNAIFHTSDADVDAKMPITIPKHEPLKKVYVEMIRQIVESEAKDHEDAE